MNVVILGLSITSSWGNGHATTFRALARALHARGHRVLFVECDKPWYAAHRDLTSAPYAAIALYDTIGDLQAGYALAVAEADLVMVGSYVPDGIAVAEWVTEVAGGITAFYDIDTPITLQALKDGTCEYLSAEIIPQFDVYLSFTGGPVLEVLEHYYRARQAVAFHCSVDTDAYRPMAAEIRWDLAYLGTYSADRQGTVDRLLLDPARMEPTRRFAVAGSQYPEEISWPQNVTRIAHLPPHLHCEFYNQQRFALNVTREAMIQSGYSPSVRLFEAAACGTPIVTDWWAGLETFFEPGREILVAQTADDVIRVLSHFSEQDRRKIGARARERILREHTADHRAAQLEALVQTPFKRSVRGANVATQEIQS